MPKAESRTTSPVSLRRIGSPQEEEQNPSPTTHPSQRLQPAMEIHWEEHRRSLP